MEHFENNIDQVRKIGLDELKEKFDITFTEEADGSVTGTYHLSPREINFYGIPYGGALFHLADCTAGAAFLAAGGIGPTVSGQIDYMRGAGRAQSLRCNARVVKNGSRLAFVDTMIYDEKDTQIAKASFIYCHTT